MATGAFFNDTETSTGNVLVAGALDLKIDNVCYYNGQACTNGYWGGEPNDPELPTNQCSCTWRAKDLGEGDVFFDLNDLKPGDWEEDTISIDVDNPSWLCADIRQTRDADNSCTEPEQNDEGGACDDPDGDGELAENLYFVFWEDDGDNVYECNPRKETCEHVITKGPASDVLGSATWALADSSTDNGPVGPDTYYIGKFFCFGEIEFSPELPGDGNPVQRGSGFTCNGKPVDNKSQTDSLEGDISFYAEQARHNEKFLCESAPPPGD